MSTQRKDNIKGKGKDKAIVLVEGEEVREAPKERTGNLAKPVNPVLNPAQLRILQGNTPDYAKKQRQGKGGKTFTYVPHGYVTDQLNSAFGWDWDLVIDPIDGEGKLFSLQLEKAINDKSIEVATHRYVAIAGHLVVKVHGEKGIIATITKWGFGSQEWLPTMEFGDALKAARSDLVKCCAYQLGIALDLYWNDTAEFQKHEDFKERKAKEKAESERLAKEFSANSIPSNPVILISRAKAEYDIDISTLAVLAKCDEEGLLALDQKRIKEIWETIQKTNSSDG